jgi:hypothetical protein
MNNITIILTATVNVNFKKSWLYQTDQTERIQTYLRSVLQWLNNTTFHIILVDNSGYKFEELSDELEKYAERFEIIIFNESELDSAKYLENNNSKGASELFAINYAFNYSKLVKFSNFTIKVTARFYIPDLQNYLKDINLDEYNCLTQYDNDRCEMVGSHIKNFNKVFYQHAIHEIDKNNYYIPHVEYMYKLRCLSFESNTILTCPKFDIEPTQRGGICQIFSDI